MRTLIESRYLYLIGCLFLPISIFCQDSEEDPFKGNYILGESSEILTITGANGQTVIDVFDVIGPIEEGNLVKVFERFEGDSLGTYGENPEMDAFSVDLDGDGRQEFVATWEGPERTVSLYIPHIEEDSIGWSERTFLSIQSLGFDPLTDLDDFFIKRQIRIAGAQLDDDPEEEFVLAYFADDGEEDSGPIQLIVFDTNGTLTPTVKAEISDIRLYPTSDPVGLRRGSRFDLSSGDFDADGIDEIVLVAVERGAPDGSRYDWDVHATIYSYVDSTQNIAPVIKSTTPIVDGRFNSSDYLKRLAVATGDINGDRVLDIVCGWQTTTTNLFSSLFVSGVAVSQDLSSVEPVDQFPQRFDGSNGSDGWPFSLIVADANYDGIDEVAVTGRNTLRVFQANQDLSIPDRSIASASLQTRTQDDSFRNLALTDMDLGDTDSLKTEFAVLDIGGLKVYQSQADTDGLDFSNNPEATGSPISNRLMIVGDFDGDAVRLAPPTRQFSSDITQPLVVLNAPPTHFDVFDGTIFNVHNCYNSGESCEHRATYVNAQSVEMEVSTEINSDWGISSSIEASVGAAKGPIAASIRGSLSRSYGEGFSNVEGQSTKVRVSVTSDAVEDDRIFATISDYEILEYPVLVDNEITGYVAVVIPRLKGIESLQNTWFSSKSGIARDFVNRHEVGNLLSYPSSVSLPPQATLFGQGGFTGGGGNSYIPTGSSSNTWSLNFDATEITERERSAFQEVSRSLEGSLSAGFGPIKASLNATISDTYAEGQIVTHKTTIQDESALMVQFGSIDASILGTKTYTVSPYVYWTNGGALVLDYAVNPDLSPGAASWWEENYGQNPDLTFILPWKYDTEKGIGSTDPELQKEETRDILVFPQNPLPGETATILARIQNFSLTDFFGTFSVRFYLGDPRKGGTLIVNQNGKSQIEIEGISNRENVVARLDKWEIPEGVNGDTKIYAVIDEENLIQEIHENNNVAWSLLNDELPSNSTSIEAEIVEASSPSRIQVFPNPLTEESQLSLTLAKRSSVSLHLYDLQGRLISSTQEGTMGPGSQLTDLKQLFPNEKNVGAGVYVVQVITEAFTESHKLIKLGE